MTVDLLLGIVRLALWAFVGALALSLVLAIALNKTARARVTWSLAVLVVFASLAAWGYYKLVTEPEQVAAEEAKKKGLPTADEYKERRAKAQALFDERCMTAGERIHRTVDNVEGVLLLNVRSRGGSASVLSDPNWPDAGLPHEPGQNGYISTFLWWEQFQDKRNDRGFLNEVPSDLPGYRFVDVREEDGSIYRYRLDPADVRKLSRDPLKGKPARYAVFFTNMTDPADRQLWVAGTRVQVIDTATNEVIAEKTWYAMEPGQGGTGGERLPWAFARQCPSHRGWNGGSTRFFVDQVLKPTKGE